MPLTVHLGTADHDVLVDGRFVDPARRQGGLALGQALGERVVDGGAPGDVAGGVLVEQRLLEDDVEPAHPRRGIDQRHLAQAPGAGVFVQAGAHHVGVGVGGHLDDEAVGEAQRKAGDQHAVHRDRPRGDGGAAVRP